MRMSRRRRSGGGSAVGACLFVAVLLTLSACSADGPRHKIQGTLDLYLSAPEDVSVLMHNPIPPGPRNADCSAGTGEGDFVTIHQGASVVNIVNGQGKTIATGKLGHGTYAREDRTHPLSRCSFAFSASVPESDSYSFVVLGRDPSTVSRADLEAKSWTVTLTIGIAVPPDG